jgi:hypothetical protein
MFNRITLLPQRTETQFVIRDVHEHRAPTDQSVELLRDMERAAEARRVAGMALEANEFHGMVEVAHLGPAYKTVASCTFELNGKRLTADTELTGLMRPTPDMMLKLRDAVAEKIANEMLGEFVRRLPQ